MIAGEIAKSELWEEYYTNLHKAYNAMWQAFKKRGLSQDQIAERLGVDKALISKRLKGRENLTLKTLSFMASAMECRLTIGYLPYEEVEASIPYYDPIAPQGSTEQSDEAMADSPLPRTINPDVETDPIEIDPYVTRLAA